MAEELLENIKKALEREPCPLDSGLYVVGKSGAGLSPLRLLRYDGGYFVRVML